ncbi:DNA-binding SARP family transcriptional activator [Kibdelosporangium banguiense]|uniref:DNA-binding SARP family transcriptional activator n=1 Tax=Kibdelosporangium banguiense TaxID=1365924 RepID=A0ABS4U0W7_9PSEU|nr:BTAD domain-containing putative transcriptional regulator [Kibdelosporangium banguiense]MBP2329873.1 DNA-binding SARP family transcriptional activator [Kibdelosporangium banguiense]
MTRTARRVATGRLTDQPPAAISVRLAGGLAVSVNGSALKDAEISSRKGRSLLACLAVRRGYQSVDRLAAAVWGERPPRDPAANIATLISRLRGSLGASAILGGRGGYRLDDEVRIDLDQAAGLVGEAERRISAGQPAAALMAAWRATHLLDRGLVLPEFPDADWAEPARTQRTHLVRQAWHAAAEAALHMDDVSSAQSAAEAAMAADAFDEAACRLLMRAYQAAGQTSKALQVYHRLRMTLAHELGVDPAPATRGLHVAILRETTAVATPTAG